MKAVKSPARSLAWLGVHLTLRILACNPSCAFAQLMTTFTNPTPAAGDSFGYSVAAFGNERVIVGAEGDDTGGSNVGAAYLFNIEGSLLATYTNPAPTTSSRFGYATASVGSDLALIGTRSGKAFLFRTNGLLVTTFTPPPSTWDGIFGASLIGFGDTRLLIGAYLGGGLGGGVGSGAAFLYRTNGVLLNTFTNPAPSSDDYFGHSFAIVGSDRILIGADGQSVGSFGVGVAYLFTTNGLLLTTFTNPTPAASDSFGCALAALGNERVVIGAYGDDRGATDAGIAYLFNTNGVLLATFTNPTPATSDNFGCSVAVLGDDRILIGADRDDLGATDTGIAHLFNTNGVLLTTFLNPTPTTNDYFGQAVAVVGQELILIAARNDDWGAMDSGVAYLFATSSVPKLKIVSSGIGQNQISWSPNTAGFVLQETALHSSANWTNSPSGATNPIVVPPTLPTKFYRLFKP